jgi:hypothetical protein
MTDKAKENIKFGLVILAGFSAVFSIYVNMRLMAEIKSQAAARIAKIEDDIRTGKLKVS